MTNREEALKTPPTTTRDDLGGYVQESLKASHGYTLAVYTWEPQCGRANAKAIAFLMHGVIGHSIFEWLAPNAENHRALLKGSMVEQLLALDIFVVAHDHPAHGRSSGLHAYVDSHDHLRDCAIDVMESFKNKPELKGKKTYVFGHSMGGTTAIRVCSKKPHLIDNVILTSPAVRPPDDMFGPYGKFLLAISPILGSLLPKLPVLKLPPSPDEDIRDAVSKDPLIYRGSLRVRMALEFLRVYSDIHETAHQMSFSSIAIFIGLKDIVVSPDGIKKFVQRIQCDDKQTFVYESLGHDVLTEKGCERPREDALHWVKDRLSA